ncbi:glycosyltransferase family 9 protein [Deltaproteobacteria bacterium IMCC39524]|nr:glycosyltransferase family 9 protein [Deltaproteobacteria bacterium IMCC39524]
MFLKKVDGLIGSLLTRFWPRPTQPESPPSPVSSLLLIRPGGIGDAVLLVPVILRLREAFPTACIDVLAEKRNSRVFSLCPGVNQVLCYDRPLELLAVLRSDYEVVIDSEQWYHLSSIVARVVCSQIKVGYGTNERKRLFTHTIDYSPAKYELNNFLELLKPLGLESPSLNLYPFLTVPEIDQESADNMLGSLLEEPFIILFPGASVAEKRWSCAKFHELAVWCEKQNTRVVIVGGEQDREAGAQIASGLSALDLTGKTSLEQTAAVLARGTVVVSTDSGILHLASALGRPTVSLFGASSQAQWAPRGPHHVVIDKSLDCSPCSSFGNVPKCQIDVCCMNEISVDDVSTVVNCLLTSLKNE